MPSILGRSGARMDWRLALAPLVILLVLAGGTVLVAQVEGDLNANLDSPIEPTPIESDSPQPLKLKDFKLPSDLKVDLPPGTDISPDLSKLTLPEDMDIQLPKDLDLSGLNFDLPEDFDFQLPEGTQFDGSKLKLPEGATIKLPDGSEWTIPPGTSLDIPPELARRLLDQGLPLGTLPRDFTLPLRDLPPGLDVGVTPPDLGSAGGSLHLPKGTEIRLPPGVTFPSRLDARALAFGLSYLLPAGTQLDIPFGPATGTGGGAFPLPKPDAPPSSQPGPAPPLSGGGVPVDTEIDTLPASVPKGQPFKVEGYVRERATGKPVAGAPVDVFLNETKAAPGVLVGSGATGTSGRFAVTVTIPSDKPARQYQLVNHAGAFSAANGVAYDEGWGDPPIYTYTTTNVTLSLPGRTSVGAQTPIQGRLTDGTGAGVPNVVVNLYVNGHLILQPRTAADGAYATTYAFSGTGVQNVEAFFPGQSPYYGASNHEQRAISVDEEITIEVPAKLSAQRGTALTVSGRVVSGLSPLVDTDVQVSVPFANAFVVRTDGQGRFSSSVSIPVAQSLGSYAITYRLPSQGGSQTQALEVYERGTLRLDAPARAVLSPAGVTIQVGLTDPRGQPLGSQFVVVTMSGPTGAYDSRKATDASGVASLVVGQRATAGTYTLTVNPSPTGFVRASPVNATMKLGVLDADWDLPDKVVRGHAVTVGVTLRLAGEPLAEEPVRLDFVDDRVGVTDAQGRVSWTLEVPRDTPVGPAKAVLTPERFTLTPFTSETRVVALPALTVEAPDEYEAAKGFIANVTLQDDLQNPIPRELVRVSMRAGNWTREQSLLTDGNGRLSVALNTTGAPRANLTLTATHVASANYLEAEASRTLSVKAADVTIRNDSVLPWLLPALGLALVGAAGGGVWWWQKKRARPVRVEVQGPPPIPIATMVRAADFEMDVAITKGEPLVWGVHEALEVGVRSRGPPRPGSVILLEGQGSRAQLILDAEGHAQATLVPDTEGDLVLRARRQDDASGAVVEMTIRIVDYRKAVAEEFDHVLDQAKSLVPSVTRQSTPREVQYLLGAYLGEAAEAPLEQMAVTLEVTNYSRSPVSRRDYLRFLDAARRVGAMLQATPRQAGA